MSATTSSPTHRAKACVLLSERPYLEKHIVDPGRYFPALLGKKVLSSAQCSDIKGQRSVEYQVQRFVELICLHEQGYDIFFKDLRTQRTHAHVAAHLKRKVAEFWKQGLSFLCGVLE